MLDQLRDLSTLPPAGISKELAERLSFLFKAVSGCAMVLAFLLFFLLPAAQPSVTKVSTTLLDSSYQCTMLAKAGATVDLSKANITVPFVAGAAPFSSLFALSGAMGISAVSNSNPTSALCGWCANTGGCTASDSNTGVYTNPGVLFDTYESCLADSARVTCTASAPIVNNNGMPAPLPQVACAIGTKGISLHLTFVPVLAGYGMAAASHPICTLPFQSRYSIPSNLEQYYPSAALSSAFATVFTPAFVCAPFAANVNPPYICTGSERQSLLSIILQSLSLYGTSIGILTSIVPIALMVLPKRKQAVTSEASAAPPAAAV